MPEISVITATYNDADVLSRAIRSLRWQTFDDYEHIIVDDGSTDDTADAVAEHGDDSVRYVPLPENQGAAAAWNRGVEAARGAYISFLDADDAYLPERLEVSRDILNDHSEQIGGVAHSYERVSNAGPSIHAVPGGEITRADMAEHNYICGTSNTMYRATVFDDVGRFDTAFPAEIDYDFQIRVLDRYRFVGIEDVLSRKYELSRGIQQDPERKYRGVTMFLEKHGDLLSPEWTAKKRRKLAKMCLELGDTERAAQHVAESLEICPEANEHELHYLVGRDYLQRGHRLAATRHLASSLRLNPSNYRSAALLPATGLPVDGEHSVKLLRSVRDALVGSPRRSDPR